MSRARSLGLTAIGVMAFTTLGALPFAMAAGAQPAQIKPGQTSPEPRSPQRIYAATCGYCHGANVGPVIMGRHLPQKAIMAFVRKGQGAMPAFRPTEISDTELAALAAWIERAPAVPKEHGQ